MNFNVIYDFTIDLLFFFLVLYRKPSNNAPGILTENSRSIILRMQQRFQGQFGLWKYLYVTLVRPHLDYAVQAWNRQLQGDIEKIERVQRRATRIPTGIEKLEYDNRLKRLSLTTLQDRRIRGDLIETYKVLSSRERIDWVKPLNLRKKRGYIWTGIKCKRKQS